MTRDAHGNGPTVFQPVVRERRLADQVADRLKETILSGQLKPGDALAPERDLSQQFGVSRTVVREAVRSLSGQGLVRAIGGSGVRVLAVDADTVGESMRALMQSAAFDYAKVDEVRRVIEVAAVGVRRRAGDARGPGADRADADQMRDHIDDLEVCAQADLAFHRALALATHNELFLMLHDSLYAPLIEVRRHNLARGVTRRRKTVTAHRKILSAVRRGDAEQAAAMMREHLGEVRRGWSETAS